MSIAPIPPLAILLTADFLPHPLVAGGHLQTLAGVALGRGGALPAPVVHWVHVGGGARVKTLQWWRGPAEDAPTAVLLHGLEGRADGPVQRSLALHAWRRGMNAVSVNMRGCGGSLPGSGALYHNGQWQDLHRVVEDLQRAFGVRRVGVVGYSMGGNMVLRAVAEWGSAPPSSVRAAVGVCPAVDLEACSKRLMHWSNQAYQMYFVAGLTVRAWRAARLLPRLKVPLGVFRSVWDFDNRVTAHLGGFGSAQEYYARCSAGPHLGDITVPTLVLHAADDPFVVITPPSRQAIGNNPAMRLVETPSGGHCGFVGGRGLAPRFWAEARAVDWLAAHA